MTRSMFEQYPGLPSHEVRYEGTGPVRAQGPDDGDDSWTIAVLAPDRNVEFIEPEDGGFTREEAVETLARIRQGDKDVYPLPWPVAIMLSPSDTELILIDRAPAADRVIRIVVARVD